MFHPLGFFRQVQHNSTPRSECYMYYCTCVIIHMWIAIFVGEKLSWSLYPQNYTKENNIWIDGFVPGRLIDKMLYQVSRVVIRRENRQESLGIEPRSLAWVASALTTELQLPSQLQAFQSTPMYTAHVVLPCCSLDLANHWCIQAWILGLLVHGSSLKGEVFPVDS